MKEKNDIMVNSQQDALLFQDACIIIEQAQEEAYRQVNVTLIKRNWLLGMRIQHEVLKDKRAGYGEQVVKNLSKQLTIKYGTGYCKGQYGEDIITFQKVNFSLIFGVASLTQFNVTNIDGILGAFRHYPTQIGELIFYKQLYNTGLIDKKMFSLKKKLIHLIIIYFSEEFIMIFLKIILVIVLLKDYKESYIGNVY